MAMLNNQMVVLSNFPALIGWVPECQSARHLAWKFVKSTRAHWHQVVVKHHICTCRKAWGPILEAYSEDRVASTKIVGKIQGPILWYTMVYYGILWYTMVYYGILVVIIYSIYCWGEASILINQPMGIDGQVNKKSCCRHWQIVQDTGGGPIT